MARLARITQLIFGSSGTPNGVFGSAQANAGPGTLSNVIATIMGLPAWLAGWLSATEGASKFPCLEEMNGVNYVVTTQLAYLFQQGVAEYDAGTTYYTNNIVCKAGTYQLYGSVTNANIGNALTDATNWQFLGDLSTIASASNIFVGGVTTGSANAQVLATISPTPPAIQNGHSIICTAGFTNTGSATFNITSLGTGNVIIKKDSPSGPVNLTGGEITLNDSITLTYNTALTCFILSAGIALGTAAYQNVGAFLQPANNLSDVSNVATALSTLGGLAKSANLSDLANLATALTNLGFVQNASGTGHIKLPGGIIINWGGTASINSAGSGTTNYDLAYSSATYVVMITPSQVGTSSAQSAVTSFNTTGFTMENATTVNQAFYYIAIGV